MYTGPLQKKKKILNGLWYTFQIFLNNFENHLPSTTQLCTTVLVDHIKSTFLFVTWQNGEKFQGAWILLPGTVFGSCIQLEFSFKMLFFEMKKILKNWTLVTKLQRFLNKNHYQFCNLFGIRKSCRCQNELIMGGGTPHTDPMQMLFGWRFCIKIPWFFQVKVSGTLILNTVSPNRRKTVMNSPKLHFFKSV